MGRFRFWWVWGPLSCWPSDEPLPAVPWLNRRSAQRWGRGQRMSPRGGQTRPGRTLISIIDVLPTQHQRGQSTPFWGRGDSLCLSHCCEKRKSSHSVPKVLSTIFYPIWFMFFSLNILPAHSWKALCLPSLLPCGCFHNGVSVLYELCGKRRDTPVSTNMLWGDLMSPQTWAYVQICFPAWACTENVMLRDHGWGYCWPPRTLRMAMSHWLVSHSTISPNFSFSRMSCKLVCRSLVASHGRLIHASIVLDTQGKV